MTLTRRFSSVVTLATLPSLLLTAYGQEAPKPLPPASSAILCEGFHLIIGNDSTPLRSHSPIR